MNDPEIPDIPVQNEAVGDGRDRAPAAMSIAFEQEAIRGIITAGLQRSLVVVAGQYQVGKTVAVDIGGCDRIDGRCLRDRREGMKLEFPVPVVLKPSA